MNSLNTREEFCLAPKGVHARQMSVCECVSVHAAHCALKLFNQVTKARVSKTFKEIENFESLKRESLNRASRELQENFK